MTLVVLLALGLALDGSPLRPPGTARGGALARHRGGSDCRRGHRHRLRRRRYRQRRPPRPGPEAVSLAPGGGRLRHRQAASDGPRFEWPYQDVFVVLQPQRTVPRTASPARLRASFTRETDLRYYGIGNASVAPPDDVPARDFYTRTHPAGPGPAAPAPLDARVRLVFGSIYTFTWLDYEPVIAAGRRTRLTGSPQLRGLLQVDRRARRCICSRPGCSYRHPRRRDRARQRAVPPAGARGSAPGRSPPCPTGTPS